MGDDGDKFYIILKGTVGIYINDSKEGGVNINAD